MTKKIIIYILLSMPLLSMAQKKDKNAQKAAATITVDDMKRHLYIIAGPEMEGRNTPSEGLNRAADYIESQFKSFGLVPGNNGSYRQVYNLYKDSMIGAAININGAALELNKDFQPQTNNYAAEMRFSEAVFAGYGISDEGNRDDYKDLNVAGKLVIIADGVPADYKSSATGFASPSSSFGKMNAAMNKGAAALIIVYNNFPRNEMRTNNNWSMNSFKAMQTPFAFTVSENTASKIMGEDGNNLFAKLKAGSLTSKTYSADVELVYAKQTQTTTASNVLGMVEGSDLKDEYVFITGHYDHLGKRGDVIYYGADDDGSGTTGVIEMAEAFAKAKAAGNGPRRSIVFMTVSGEEKGLWGSAYYSNHPVFPLEKTTVDLNIDMIGRTDSSRHVGDSLNYVYVVGDDKISTDLKIISEAANKLYTKLELDYKFNDPNDRNRIYFRSDHYNFAAKGVPIIFYYDGMLKADYHKPTDTPDKINYPLMAKRAQLVFYTAWEMANRNDMLKRDIKLEVPKR
ncbi:MAG: M28 family peptidase [Chitinophagaceae bacterium]|nr:M28 family peptidase [Chitinophagaceae bacterium]MBP9103745.1 M28 family peptidase [Chitinophagaceae bacterium]